MRSSVAVFLDQLDALPLSRWLDVGRRVDANRDVLPVRSTAAAIMDASIAHHGLGLAAWNVQEAVETIAFLRSRSGERLSRSDRRAFAAAEAAAEDAALATLVREHLSPQDFAVLCAPFADSASAVRGQSADLPRSPLQSADGKAPAY